jgi:hypothetical protein
MTFGNVSSDAAKNTFPMEWKWNCQRVLQMRGRRLGDDVLLSTLGFLQDHLPSVWRPVRTTSCGKSCPGRSLQFLASDTQNIRPSS